MPPTRRPLIFAALSIACVLFSSQCYDTSVGADAGGVGDDGGGADGGGAPDASGDGGQAGSDAGADGGEDGGAADLDGSSDAGTSTDAGTDAGADAGPGDAGLPSDQSELVAHTLPDAMACGETRAVTVTFKNTGSATWAPGTHALGAVGDGVPLHAGTRIALTAGETVVTGAAHDFTFDLVAPAAAGTYTTDWQMVHEGAAWFGPIASSAVTVTCPAPDGEAVLAGAIIVNSPTDTPSWAVTTTISKLRLGADGVEIDFDKKDGPNRWPDVTPPGWDGPLQYTLWLALNINGQWYASGIIQYWYGLAASGGDVTANDQIATNWVYDGRWGAMEGHQPAPGEHVGFMVSAGNVRGVTDGSQSPVHERSNMVIVPFPAVGDTVFTF